VSEDLNKFAALGKDFRVEARNTIQIIFTDASFQNEVRPSLINAQDANLQMPVMIRDYTDFYSSKNHAYNVGVMFRGPENAL
jgi:fumarylacetoacetase